MKDDEDKKTGLRLVSTVSDPLRKSHLDIAIRNSFLKDVSSMMISPEGEQFHLSMKVTIYGYKAPLWINEFGTRVFVIDMALKAINHVLKAGSPVKRNQLHDFKSDLTSYRQNADRILILPPQRQYGYDVLLP